MCNCTHTAEGLLGSAYCSPGGELDRSFLHCVICCCFLPVGEKGKKLVFFHLKRHSTGTVKIRKPECLICEKHMRRAIKSGISSSE